PEATAATLWALDAATGGVRWRTDSPWYTPAVADGTGVSGSSRLGLLAFDTTTGRRLWQSPVGGHPPPGAGARGVLYAADGSRGELMALDIATGTERWRIDVGGSIDCCVAVAGGAAYVATLDGVVLAIGAADGSPDVVGSPTVMQQEAAP